MSRRIELFFYDSQNWTLLYNFAHRIVPFSMNVSQNRTFLDDAKNGFLEKMPLRIEPCQKLTLKIELSRKWSTNWTLFF